MEWAIYYNNVRRLGVGRPETSAWPETSLQVSPRSVISHLINPTGDMEVFTLKKLIALAAAGILALSVAAFAEDAAKTTDTKSTETKSTTTEMKKDDAGNMKKTTTKKHKKSTKSTKKTEEKPMTTEAAPKTN